MEPIRDPIYPVTQEPVEHAHRDDEFITRLDVLDNVQYLINGRALGAIYGLIAIGYTMVFGIIGMVNFAHGDVFMISAFIALICFMAVTALAGMSGAAVFLALLVALIVPLVGMLRDRPCSISSRCLCNGCYNGFKE